MQLPPKQLLTIICHTLETFLLRFLTLELCDKLPPPLPIDFRLQGLHPTCYDISWTNCTLLPMHSLWFKVVTTEIGFLAVEPVPKQSICRPCWHCSPEYVSIKILYVSDLHPCTTKLRVNPDVFNLKQSTALSYSPERLNSTPSPAW